MKAGSLPVSCLFVLGIAVILALPPPVRAWAAAADACQETEDLMRMDLAFLEPLNTFISDREDNLNTLEGACMLFRVVVGEVDDEPIIVSGYVFEEEYIESYIQGRMEEFGFTRTQAVIYYLKTQPLFLLKRLRDYLSLVVDGKCAQNTDLVKRYLSQVSIFKALVDRLPKPEDCAKKEIEVLPPPTLTILTAPMPNIPIW